MRLQEVSPKGWNGLDRNEDGFPIKTWYEDGPPGVTDVDFAGTPPLRQRFYDDPLQEVTAIYRRLAAHSPFRFSAADEVGQLGGPIVGEGWRLVFR